MVEEPPLFQPDLSALAVPEELAVPEDFQEIKIANGSKKTGLRTEWRINANTGKLRGVSFRERNKERKEVHYVGQRSHGQRADEFARYQRVFNDRSRSVGNRLDGNRSPGGDGESEIIPLPENWPGVGRILED